jgi:hypothetical protein
MGKKTTKAMAILEERFKDTMTVLDYPNRYRYTYHSYAQPTLLKFWQRLHGIRQITIAIF